MALAKKEDRPVREKHLNIARFGLIEGGAVKRARYNVIRFVVVLATMVAWFSISNHCALGGAIVKTKSAVAPMHCHGNQPAPSKKSSDEEMPCCKMLRATLPALQKNAAAYDMSAFVLQPYVVDLVLFAEQFHGTRPLEFDTGPPFSRSFAELVLQRSILAHAPPVLS